MSGVVVKENIFFRLKKSPDVIIGLSFQNGFFYFDAFLFSSLFIWPCLATKHMPCNKDNWIILSAAVTDFENLHSDN